MTLGIKLARPGIAGEQPRLAHSTVFNKNFFNIGNLWLALGAVLGMQVLAVHWSRAQTRLDTAHLTSEDWLLAIAVASSVLLLDEGRRWLVRRVRGKPMATDASCNAKNPQETTAATHVF